MRKLSLNRGWKFFLGENPQGHHQKVDDTTWQVVDLPHDWSIDLERNPANPSAASGGFFPMGRGYYRKSLDVSEEWRGKKVFVEFEGVYMNAEVSLNEHFIGRHPYGYTGFIFDLTPYLNFSGENILRVMVDNSSQLNSRWYSGSGIYRYAWILVSDPVHIHPWGQAITTPEVSQDGARLHLRTRVENETGSAHNVLVRWRILSPEGHPSGTAESTSAIAAGSQHEYSQEMFLAGAQLWSLETPHIYQVRTEVVLDGAIVDQETTRFGIRTLNYDAEQGFRLNGQPLKMKGGCVHHDNGILGAASYNRSEERKVEVLKASGFNAIRCAHNPPAPAFLDACDRLGMLVIDEAFDCWRDGKNPFDYHVVFDDWWQRDIESMVRRDRNHPSVVVWSIGNELVERGRPEGAVIARTLADYVRTLDPTRPVTAAICGPWDGWSWPQTDAVFESLDIGGYNYLFRHYRPDHERFPNASSSGLEFVPKEAFDNWMSVLDLNHVIGDFVWTSLDYLGESGIGRVHYDGEKAPFLGDYPWHQANCGDLDLCGFKRPQLYYRNVLWQTGDPLYIAVHYPIPEGKTPTLTYWGWPDVGANWTWPGLEGQLFKVDVYSACEKVELFFNGNSMGVQPTTRQEKFMASFDVPYAPGELKVIGYTQDAPASECILATVSDPVAVRLSPDRIRSRLRTATCLS